jgi:hypothetical protein
MVAGLLIGILLDRLLYRVPWERLRVPWQRLRPPRPHAGSSRDRADRGVTERVGSAPPR